MGQLYARGGSLQKNILLELLQLKNTSDGTDIETEKHASEAGGASHGEGTPSIDLCRIGLDSVILDDGSDDLRAGTDFAAHDCGVGYGSEGADVVVVSRLSYPGPMLVEDASECEEREGPPQIG